MTSIANVLGAAPGYPVKTEPMLFDIYPRTGSGSTSLPFRLGDYTGGKEVYASRLGHSTTSPTSRPSGSRAASAYDANIDAILKPTLSDEEITKTYGGRLQSAAEAGATRGIYDMSRALGGDTDSPFFQFASGALRGGADVDATGRLNEMLLENKNKQRAMLLSALQSLLGRVGTENQAQAIDDSYNLGVGRLNLGAAQLAAQIAESERRSTSTGGSTAPGGIWNPWSELAVDVNPGDKEGGTDPFFF